MLYTKSGSHIVLTGKFAPGIRDGKPELLVECHLAAGNTGTIELGLSEICADGGFQEIKKTVLDIQQS